jgi:nucleoid-associated protein YejK
MSHYTWVQFDVQGDEEISRDALMACARKRLEEANCYAVEEMMADLRKSFENNGAYFAVYPEDIDLMVQAMARQFSQHVIGFRAVGEEFHNVWLRQYRGDEALVDIGPFEPVDSL